MLVDLTFLLIILGAISFQVYWFITSLIGRRGVKKVFTNKNKEHAEYVLYYLMINSLPKVEDKTLRCKIMKYVEDVHTGKIKLGYPYDERFDELYYGLRDKQFDDDLEVAVYTAFVMFLSGDATHDDIHNAGNGIIYDPSRKSTQLKNLYSNRK